MLGSFDALIFDCDGVLVDSEALAQAAELHALAGIGLHYPQDEFSRRFTGTSTVDMNAAIAADYRTRFGTELVANFFDQLDAAIQSAYEQHLQPIEGAVEMARRWHKPKAVASSSSQDMVELKLRKVGLAGEFEPHVFTAASARAKPHPDLFLLAATKLEVEPRHCLVIEDSINGVLAAKAAGMRVIGFTGGAHCLPDHHEDLIQSGADWVHANYADIARDLESHLAGCS